MPAVKYSHNYEQQSQPQHKKSEYTSFPIKKDSEKKYTHNKKSAKQINTAINFALLTFGGILTLFFIAIYSVVALSETKLANLHAKISELNYENIELENKLENVKSYYSVDNKVAATTDFDKAKNVLEVNRVDAKTTPHIEPKTNHLNTVTGF